MEMIDNKMENINHAKGGIINGHEWVDLGLSVKWATCNIGASTSCEHGDLFAWGETEPKSEYSWKNYKFRLSGEYAKATFNKYTTRPGQKPDGLVQTGQFSWVNMPPVENEQSIVDNKTRLDLSDDAARVNWGGSWRMPTTEELDELITKCDWEQALIGDNRDRVYRVTSKINGNSIVLPYNGGRTCCWSSSLRTGEPFKAYGIEFGYSHIFESDMIGWTSESRCKGLSVRPVSD